MIVRDSAATLPACLESIRQWVDELIVVDTGSVDNTREIARHYGAHIFEFPWIDDFAAARNESLKHASGKWLFWMDSDDTIDSENGRKLRELSGGQHADDVLGYVMQVHCPVPASNGGGDDTTIVDHVKLFRNRLEIRFEGRIHEQVIPAIRRLGGEVGWTDLFVVHSGVDHSSEAKQRKYDRDLRILKLDLAERPDHPFVLFNLGMTYDDMGRHQESETWLRRSLAVSDPGESHVRKAYALLASSLDRQGKPHEAHDICRRGLQLFPDDEELLFRLGNLEHRAKNYGGAIRAFRTILNHRQPRHFSSVDRGITGYKARHNLALVYEDAGRLDLAEVQWRHVLEERPSYEPARQSLQRLLHNQGRLMTLSLSEGTLTEETNAPKKLLPKRVATARSSPSKDRGNNSSLPKDVSQHSFEWVSLAKLAAATRELAAQLPSSIAGIVGIPRSGMIPASILSTLLQAPLFELAQDGSIRPLHHGCRGYVLGWAGSASGPLVVVDDTVYGGNSMMQARDATATIRDRLVYAAVFVRPDRTDLVDFYGRLLPSPHLLEWNFFNSGVLTGNSIDPVLWGGAALDFDGILCHDPTVPDADEEPDVEPYVRWLRSAAPRWLPRRVPAKCIITARLERWRSDTEQWLNRHGVAWERLVMHPAKRASQRNAQDVAAWKANALASSGCRWYVESDYHQAERIFHLSGRSVICPDAEIVFH
jgi:tetratricopeptide (TPR) repeat protein